MAKQVKVNSDEIERIGKEIDTLIDALNNNYAELEKNKVLITESWQSAAAIKYVDNISKTNKKLKDSLKEINEAKQYVNKTSKRIREADDTIKKRIAAII